MSGTRATEGVSRASAMITVITHRMPPHEGLQLVAQAIAVLWTDAEARYGAEAVEREVKIAIEIHRTLAVEEAVAERATAGPIQ